MKTIVLNLLLFITALLAFSAHSKQEFYIPNDDDIAAVEKLYKNQDYQQAFELYSKMAKSGDNYAQYKLSIMYLLGQGTEINEEKAYSWAFVAKTSKQPEFLAYFKQLESNVIEEYKDEFERSALHLLSKYNDLSISKRFLKYLKKEFPKCTGSGLRSISACNRIQVMCEGNFFGNYLYAKDSCKEFLVKIQPENLKVLSKAINRMKERVEKLEERNGQVIVSEGN